MAQHSKYWSCTKFADWIRGSKKLSSGTAEEWDEWTTAAQMKHNFRYWVAEEALGCIQDFVTAPTRGIYSVKYYINNRWVTKSHALTAHAGDIKPGDWRDVGNRFLPCLFNELVNFVEIETAWSHIAWGDKATRAKYDAPFYATGWWRLRTWRCPQAGIDHLDWAAALTNNEWLAPDHKDYNKPTQQAISAKEIKDLYTWWAVTYRNRPDAMEASGWSAHCAAMRLKHPGSMFSRLNTEGKADKAASAKAIKLMTKIEQAYKKEDEEMMIRLIRIRDALWT
jgi:hypothetical protein